MSNLSIKLLVIFCLPLFTFQCSKKNSEKIKIAVEEAAPFNTTYQALPIENITVRNGNYLKKEDVHYLEEVPFIHRVRSVGDDYYLLTWDKSGANNRNDYYLAKLNKKGQLVWKKSYNDDKENKNEAPADLIYKNDKFYVASASFGKDGSANNFNVSSIDKKGKLLWSQILYLPSFEVPIDLLINDKKIYCVGRGMDLPTKIRKVQICQFSLDGKNYSCNDNKENFDGMGFSVQELNDSTLIILAMNEEGTKKWLDIIAVDKNLNYKWTKKIIDVKGGIFPEAEMIKDSDGNILIQSQVFVEGFGVQILVSKLNRSGNLMWNKSYGYLSLAGGSVGSQMDKRKFIQPSVDGGAIVGGNTGGDRGYGTSYIFEINQAGEVNWSCAYFSNQGDITDVSRCAEGYIVSGYYRESNKRNTASKGFIFKTDFKGNLVRFE